MKRHGHEGDDRLRVVDSAGIGAARRLARSRAATLGFSEGRVDDVVLAVSELVTNALQHGGGDVLVETFNGTSSDAEVAVIEVAVSSAESVTSPVLGEPAPPSQIRGRGLAIVASVADSVHVDRDAGRVVVRCTFAGP